MRNINDPCGTIITVFHILIKKKINHERYFKRCKTNIETKTSILRFKNIIALDKIHVRLDMTKENIRNLKI